MAEVYNNDTATSLTASIGPSDTTISVASSSEFNTAGTFRIRIDDEVMTVTGVSGNTWTVTRASEVCEGVQQAVAHDKFAAVYGVLTVGSLIAGFTGGGGSGTVTSVSIVTANGFSGSVANPTTTPAITISLGAHAISYSQMQQASAATLLGNPTAGLANLQEITLGTNLSFSGSVLNASGGSGTVSSVSVVTANGVSGSVANPTTTPAITITLGAITPSSVAASGSVTGSNLSGTNTGDQTITLTGDVTGSGTGSFSTTIGSHTVSYAKIQQASAHTLLGNPTASTANVSEITLGTNLSFSGSVLNAGSSLNVKKYGGGGTNLGGSANSDGSVLFQDGSGNLSQDSPGNFFFDPLGLFGPLSLEECLYIGDQFGNSARGNLALWSPADNFFHKISGDVGEIGIDVDLHVHGAIRIDNGGGVVTVNGSISGSADFVEPFHPGTPGVSGCYGKVIIYCNALNGTASWTFDAPFLHTPVVMKTTGLSETLVTSLSTTGVTVTGTTSTGILIIEGM